MVRNCSATGAGIRIVWNGAAPTDECIAPNYAKILGASHQVADAYTHHSC